MDIKIHKKDKVRILPKSKIKIYAKANYDESIRKTNIQVVNGRIICNPEKIDKTSCFNVKLIIIPLKQLVLSSMYNMTQIKKK